MDYFIRFRDTSKVQPDRAAWGRQPTMFDALSYVKGLGKEEDIEIIEVKGWPTPTSLGWTNFILFMITILLFLNLL